MSSPSHSDPTMLPPPGYRDLAAACQVYEPAFRLCFDYLTSVRIAGAVLEFGTYRGFTARLMATIIKQLDYPAKLYLYDSFEGLPDSSATADGHSYEISENKRWSKGSMALEPGIDELILRSLSRILPPARLTIIKGFFADTLDHNLPAEKAALIHVDCDLYASAKTVLERLMERDLFQDGCLLLFDDYNCNRASPFMGERRAFNEVFGRQSRWSYSSFFRYGWHGWAFFVHDTRASDALPAGE